MTHTPTTTRLGILATFRCNLSCPHCNSICPQAPSREDVTVQNVQRLIDDSLKLKWPWELLELSGGEPTMHPQFGELCKMLAWYKRWYNPAVELHVSTNGVGKAVEAGIAVAESHGFIVHNSHKDWKRRFNPLPQGHIPFCQSPGDYGETYKRGCFHCTMGMAFTNAGFWECKPAAAMSRVFGYKPCAERLADVTPERLASGFEQHCRHCGIARDFKLMGDVRGNWWQQRLFWFSMRRRVNWDAETSPTWVKALAAYKAKKP